MKIKNMLPMLIFVGAVVAFAIYGIIYSDKLIANAMSMPDYGDETTDTTVYVFADIDDSEGGFAREVGIDIRVHSNYPEGYQEKLENLLANNPDAADFVKNYVDKYGTYEDCTLETTTGPEGLVPLYMQWDQRWGYREYGADAMGFTGCGPTCLSMVASYLLDDNTLTPAWMAEFSEDNGYCVMGSGTSWSLMSEGASMLGLDVTELPVDEQRVINNLEVGNPIICIMGPGYFTNEGHFIVLTHYYDGFFTVNDPNSYENSNRLWTWSEICDQIQDMWVYRVL